MWSHVEFAAIDWSTHAGILLIVGTCSVLCPAAGLLLRATMALQLKRGWGIARYMLLVALWMASSFWLPFRVMDHFMVEKSVLQFFLGSFSVMWMFKSLEIILGTFPKGANASYTSWALYCFTAVQPEDSKLEKGQAIRSCTPVLVRRNSVIFEGSGKGAAQEPETRYCDIVDGRFVDAPSDAFGKHMKRAGWCLVSFITCLNVLVAFQMRPFNQSALLGSCLNTFLLVMCLWLQMQHTADLATANLAVLGYKGVALFRNPLFASTSPIDFWSRRWNLTMHGMLKRSIFKPLLLLGLPKWLAIIAVFIVSACVHEYMWSVMCYSRGFVRGTVSIFFLYQAIICLLQRFLEQKLPNVKLPRLLQWLLTVVVMLPSGHLFIDSLESTLRDFASIYPMVVRW